jgi:hypothetical protein
MISCETRLALPARFIGVQAGFGDDYPSVDLFTLNEQVGEHPADSTVSRQTLESHGYTVPPRAELMKMMRGRPGRTRAA